MQARQVGCSFLWISRSPLGRRDAMKNLRDVREISSFHKETSNSSVYLKRLKTTKFEKHDLSERQVNVQ